LVVGEGCSATFPYNHGKNQKSRKAAMMTRVFWYTISMFP
jgi:hypothetical protein